MERRYGRINFIVTMPFLIPITFRRTFLGMYLRDIAFYSVLILLPAFLGLLIAALIVPYSLVSVGLMFLALFMSFLLGISLSFAISVLYTRSLAAFAIVVVGLMAFLAGAGMLDLYPLGTAVPSLGMQLHFPPFQDRPLRERRLPPGLSGLVRALHLCGPIAGPERVRLQTEQVRGEVHQVP